MNLHSLTFHTGTDANNHVVRCACGWSFSSTYHAVRDRGQTHALAFKFEDRTWNDPRRQRVMPGTASWTP